jgi:hypothetical protein
MYVNAANQADALKIARERIEADWSGAAGMEWDPVSEIQDTECPEIADDLEESDVLPVDDTPRPPHSRSPNMQTEITVSLDCITSIAALLTLELLVMSHIPHPGYPGHELFVQHFREFGNLLRPGQRIVIGAEPLKAEAGQ